MSRPALAAVAVSIAIVAALAVIGLRTAERDRAEIRARLAAAKLASLSEAAGELAHDVEKIGEDLELAATLMTQTADADSPASATITGKTVVAASSSGSQVAHGSKPSSIACACGIASAWAPARRTHPSRW